MGLGEGYSDIFILSSDHFPVQNFEFSGVGGGGQNYYFRRYDEIVDIAKLNY